MSSGLGGFALILDSLDVSDELPFEIIPDHRFRRAEPQEIDRIKRELSTHRRALFHYEYGTTLSDKGSTEQRHLPPDEWKYYVISFYGFNDKIRDIEYAANLLKDDISIGYVFFNDINGLPGGIGYSPAEVSTFFIDNYITLETPKSIGHAELREITTNYNLITGLDNTRYPNVSRAVSDFHQTKMITNRSILKVLSYFSIIECLLTHPPIPSDRMDSLTRQITTKMLLLSKYFLRELQYNLYFPSITDLEKVWKKLYEYRSLLAHGGEIDFKQKFSALVSNNSIRVFLMESLKLLLLYALKEPEFLADLQKC
jgi:hypothetical protein